MRVQAEHVERELNRRYTPGIFPDISVTRDGDVRSTAVNAEFAAKPCRLVRKSWGFPPSRPRFGWFAPSSPISADLEKSRRRLRDVLAPKAQPPEVARSEIANALLDAFVLEIGESERAGKFDVPAPAHSHSSARQEVYHAALVSLAPVGLERKEPAYASVAVAFQQAALSRLGRSLDQTLSTLALNDAGRHLLRLINREVEPFDWSREWFAAFEVEIVNPATLSMFAMIWLQTYVTICKFLSERVQPA
jgi:hypothetical protein